MNARGGQRQVKVSFMMCRFGVVVGCGKPREMCLRPLGCHVRIGGEFEAHLGRQVDVWHHWPTICWRPRYFGPPFQVQPGPATLSFWIFGFWFWFCLSDRAKDTYLKTAEYKKFLEICVCFLWSTDLCFIDVSVIRHLFLGRLTKPNLF